MLEWKEIANFTHQLQVEGGYIIRYSGYGNAMVFVPHCVQIQQQHGLLQQHPYGPGCSPRYNFGGGDCR